MGKLGSIALVLASASLLIGASCRPKPLRARQITAETTAADGIAGSDATGGIGDWELTNGLVEAIVDDVGYQADVMAATGQPVPIQTGFALSGGMLVDVANYREGNDQLNVLYPVFNYNPDVAVKMLPASEALRDASLPSIVSAVDSVAGEASLTVYGRVLMVPGVPLVDQPLLVRQKYSLRRGEAFLRIESEITNQDASASYTSTGIADATVLGPGGMVPFVPWPGRGFQIANVDARVPFLTWFGLIGREDGPAHDSGMASGDASYTIVAPDDPKGPFLLSRTTAGMSITGTIPAPTLLAPGARFTYERRLYVGKRGDVASSAMPALAAFSAKTGLPTGTIQGRVVTADGTPFRASLEITQTDLVPQTPAVETLVSGAGGVGPLPITQIRADTASAGGFSTTLPGGRYELRITAEERQPIGPVSFVVTPDALTDLGTFTLSDDGTLLFEVTDASTGQPMPARLTIKGKTGPDPRFGTPIDLTDAGVAQDVGSRAAVPYGNTTYAPSGHGALAIRPGEYRLIASRGPEWDVATIDVSVPAGGSASASLALPRVVDTSGWIAADFHVHASPSADSSVPPQSRVASMVGEGVEAMVSADHDMLFDYAPVIESMGVGAEIASLVGTELTSNQGPAPFRDGVGHFNGWPLTVEPDARKNGTPEDDGVEPNVLYDRLRARGAAVVQMNHPEWSTLGFLSNLGYDPYLPITAPINSFLLRQSVLGTGTRNVDVDAIELLNGLTFNSYPRARDVWMGLLDQGYVMTATAASDTHRIAVSSPGLPRTLVRVADDSPASFDEAGFDASLRAMHAIGTSGPFVEAELLGAGGAAGIGETLTATSGPVSLHVRVQAPCWIPVGSLRVYANGALYLQSDIASATCSTALRFEGTFTLTPTQDTAYVVEVEERLPRDTSSFYKQIAAYLYRGMTFLAFTNPLFVDVDGNGSFDPPGA